MISNYFDWLTSDFNFIYYVTTNTLLVLLILILCWIGDQIIDYINLKEDVKELKEEVKKLEKRKKK